MKIKTPIPYPIVMAIGLLSISLVNLINLFIKVPDFVRGFFVGFGFIFVLTGFFAFVKQRKQPPLAD